MCKKFVCQAIPNTCLLMQFRILLWYVHGVVHIVHFCGAELKNAHSSIWEHSRFWSIFWDLSCKPLMQINLYTDIFWQFSSFTVFERQMNREEKHQLRNRNRRDGGKIIENNLHRTNACTTIKFQGYQVSIQASQRLNYSIDRSAHIHFNFLLSI